MGTRRILAAVCIGALALGLSRPTEVRAGALDGFAGAAVGFALGAMVAGSRPAYGRPRVRRAVVYRSQPVRHHYASAPRRSSGFTGQRTSVNAASDPFASSARPVPVSAR